MKHYLMGLLGALTLTACATNDTSYAAKGEYFQPHPDRSEAWNMLSAGIKNTKIRDASAPADAWNDTGAFSYAASGLAGFAMDGLAGAAAFTGLNWFSDGDYPLDAPNIIVWFEADYTRYDDATYQKQLLGDIEAQFLASIVGDNKIIESGYNKRAHKNKLVFESSECGQLNQLAKQSIISHGGWESTEPSYMNHDHCIMYYDVDLVRPVRDTDWVPDFVKPNQSGYVIATIRVTSWYFGENILGQLPNSATFVPYRDTAWYADAQQNKAKRYVGRGFPYMYADGEIYLFIRPNAQHQASLPREQLNGKTPFYY